MAKIFNWDGFEGNNPKNGMIESESAEKAISQLARQGIMVINIEENESAGQKDDSSGKKILTTYKAKRIKNKDKVIFTKKLTTMVKSGLPILKTLRMLEEQAGEKNMKVVASQIRQTVEGGSTLSDAFQMHAQVFDSVYINLLKAGETSGKLTTFLEKLVLHLEKIEKIRRKIKSALMYPIILVCVAVSVILVMLIKVVPVFQAMFSNVGSKLPGPTRAIISISEFLRNPAQGGVALVIVVVFFYGFRYMKKNNPAFRKYYDKKILKIPLIGDVIIKSTLSKVAMISSNLSAAGVSVIESLNIIAKSVSNVIYLEAFEEIKKGVAEGKNLSLLYSQHEVIFPPAFWQMIEVGEETGRIDEMLNAIANYYEEDFNLIVDRLTELLEPIMIVFMGITIGFIIVAMYMPIFQIGKVISSG